MVLLLSGAACGNGGSDSDREVPKLNPARPIDPRLRSVTYTLQDEDANWDDRGIRESGTPSLALVYDDAPLSFRYYCVDQDHFLTDQTVHRGFLYSSYEALPRPSGVLHPDALDLFNYALEKYRAGSTFTPAEGAPFVVTPWHLQETAWLLVSAGDRDFSPEALALAADARAHGEGFVPGPGQHGAVLILGEENFDPDVADVQTVAIDVLTPGTPPHVCIVPDDRGPCLSAPPEGGTPEEPH
jgi:hypothetical protein